MKKNIGIIAIIIAAMSTITVFAEHTSQQKNSANPMVIEEAFVAFATENYFPLLEVLLESLQQFSTRPVVAWGINADIPFSFPHLIKKRLDVPAGTDMYHLKPRIIRDSGIRYGVYLDADTVVNQEIDNLFALSRLGKHYPICPINSHAHYDEQPLMDALKVTVKTIPYIHSSCIMFSNKCHDFLDEWYQAGIRYKDLALHSDERTLNVLLWKHNAHHYAPFCSPFYGMVDCFLAGQKVPRGFGSLEEFHYYMFCSCKDPKQAREMLNKLVAFKQGTIQLDTVTYLKLRTEEMMLSLYRTVRSATNLVLNSFGMHDSSANHGSLIKT